MDFAACTSRSRFRYRRRPRCSFSLSFWRPPSRCPRRPPSRVTLAFGGGGPPIGRRARLARRMSGSKALWPARLTWIVWMTRPPQQVTLAAPPTTARARTRTHAARIRRTRLTPVTHHAFTKCPVPRLRRRGRAAGSPATFRVAGRIHGCQSKSTTTHMITAVAARIGD